MNLDLFKFVTLPDDTLNRVIFVIGTSFLLAAVFVPTKFAGIEMSWTAIKRLSAVIVGFSFIAFSYPQLRFWQSDRVSVSLSQLQEILNLAESARGWSHRAMTVDCGQSSSVANDRLVKAVAQIRGFSSDLIPPKQQEY